MHWILDTLTKSSCISEIVLNTDDKQIADLARDHFDVTIHMRPEYLLTISNDEANQIMAYDLSITKGEHFLQTHSTNPLLKPETVDRAVEFYFSHLDTNDSVFSVTPVQKRFFWETGEPINHDPKKLIKTQELPVVYEENSCIYMFSRESFETARNRIGTHPALFAMDPYEAVDIDEPFDFSIAEAIMSERLSGTI